MNLVCAPFVNALIREISTTTKFLFFLLDFFDGWLEIISWEIDREEALLILYSGRAENIEGRFCAALLDHQTKDESTIEAGTNCAVLSRASGDRRVH